MNKVKTRKVILAGAVLFLGMPAIVEATGGIIGDCVDCHTMHNSEQGKPVAIYGTSTTPSANPIGKLLRMDCIACHAADPTGGSKIVDMGGGSRIPQVMHADASGDLAGGNFSYIISGGNRKGHNVVDVVPADSENLFPPGHRDGHLADAPGQGKFDVENFTCAGSMGCHGFRGQALSSFTVNCDEETGLNLDTLLPCTAEELEISGVAQVIYRTGTNALEGYEGPTGNMRLTKGAHHQSFDGIKTIMSPNQEFYDNPLANSYRFIRGLKGYGNEVERWQNNSPTSHNEYFGGYENTPFGDTLKSTDYQTSTLCCRCHLGGQGGGTSRLQVPGNTITGFCVTCHGTFHSSGATNGTSGAFLRHPSDWVIPDRDEYSSYTVYNLTAPVARPSSFFVDGMTASATVVPGRDLVMCLSCHVAHAGPYNGMLRFDYAEQVAGTATSGLATGCLGCHTTKGILPERSLRYNQGKHTQGNYFVACIHVLGTVLASPIRVVNQPF